MSPTFNIIVQTLTQVAQEVLFSPVLYDLLFDEGATREDWESLVELGQLAEAADREQREAKQALALSQDKLDSYNQIIDAGVRDIKRRKQAISDDLREDSSSSEGDWLFVKDLAFSVSAPTSKETSAASKSTQESLAQDARALQLVRLLTEIEKRPYVAAAFERRRLTAAIRASLLEAASALPEVRRRRDQAYLAWREAGAWEHAAVTRQRRVWDNIRQGVVKVARQNQAIKALYERLQNAKEQAKTGQKRTPKTTAAPNNATH